MGLSARSVTKPGIAAPIDAERPSWTERIAWEPLLRLAARSLSARAAWLRVGGEIRIVTVGGDLPRYSEAWLTAISRHAADDFLTESSAGAHVYAVGLDNDIGAEPGSVGVMLQTVKVPTVAEVREVLADVVVAVRGELALAGEAERSADAARARKVLGKAVSNMQLGVTITDAEGRIVFTNPAEAEMHGYDRDELIGQPAHVLAPPTLRRAISIMNGRADTSWTRESVNRHRDGREFPVLLWSDMIEDDEGGFGGVVTCAEDLTERREVEAALRRSESMFRAIFDNAPVGLALLGDDTWIVRANPRLCAMLGLDGQPSSETRLSDFVHPDDAAGAQDFYARALSNANEATRSEHRLGGARTDFLWIHATISPILDTSGRGQLWIALIEDTTKRRALEEQLRHSQKMEAVGRLAGGVAHDFNNLLTAIRGISELLLLEADTDHPMAADIREIHRAADTAADLTRQLLTFSRRQITQYHIQSLNTIVAENEKMLRRLTGDELELTTELDPDLAPILGDQSQIEQVLLNLTVNARDATPPGGSVHIRTRNVRAPIESVEHAAAGRFVELSVEDTGSGIDPMTLSQIFDPFFTTKPQGRGTGLGLSTVYGIVTQSGGHVWVDSEVGKGTTFRVWFPVANADLQLLPDAIFGPIKTILVLHEEQTRRALAAELLEDSGYRVLMPESPGDAHRLAETYGDRIHLMIVDHEIDGLSGVDIATGIRNLREDMKVVVLTHGVGEMVDCHDCGFQLLDREARPEKYLESIRRLLDEVTC